MTTLKTIKLNTKARDNHGYSYDVSLEESARTGHLKNDYVLRIHTTPGSWYMTTLEARQTAANVISIDHGAKWDCINFTEVMDAALQALTGVERITQAEDKAHDDALWANLLRKAA